MRGNPHARFGGGGRKRTGLDTTRKVPGRSKHHAAPRRPPTLLTVYNDKMLNSIQTWPPGFSAMYHYTKFDMASMARGRPVRSTTAMCHGNRWIGLVPYHAFCRALRSLSKEERCWRSERNDYHLREPRSNLIASSGARKGIEWNEQRNS